MEEIINCEFCGVAVVLGEYPQHIDWAHGAQDRESDPVRTRNIAAAGLAAAKNFAATAAAKKEGIETLLGEVGKTIAHLRGALDTPLADIVRTRLAGGEEREATAKAELQSATATLAAAEMEVQGWEHRLALADDRLFWDELLPQFGDFPGVVLTGGAVRDHVLGRVAEDFDVFVPLEGMEFDVAVATLYGMMPEKTIQVMVKVQVERRYYRGYEDQLVSKMVKDYQKNEERKRVSFIWQGRRVDVVFVPCERDELVARLRAEFVHPLNMGVYDGRKLDLPPGMVDDLTNRRVTVYEDQLPPDVEGLAEVAKRTKRLADKLGWEVRLMK